MRRRGRPWSTASHYQDSAAEPGRAVDHLGKEDGHVGRPRSFPGGTPRQEDRTFATMTGSRRQAALRLVVEAVTHVAMASAGVHRKAVFNILEDPFTV